MNAWHVVVVLVGYASISTLFNTLNPLIAGSLQSSCVVYIRPTA